MVLTNEELSNIQGGGAKYGWYAFIGAMITLIVGIIDGYLRPLGCNK
jgi:lactobin A/cerein 7B family class IIb bacteriocin